MTTTDWLIERVRANVRVLKAHRNLSDEAIARTAGYSSRQVLSARLNGRTDMSSEDYARIASALRVEPHVLMMRADEVLAWIEDHPAYKAPKYRKQPGQIDKGNYRRGTSRSE